ncbi:phosphatase PAP2 family protein [Bacteroidota bacterium]
MKKLLNHLFILRATDLIVIIFASLLSLLNIIFINKVENWLNHLVINSLVIIIVFVIAYYDKYRNSVFWQQLHFWYLVPMIFLCFKEIFFMLKPIRQIDYDEILINIDRFIFSTDPTYALFSISNPYLTELLQIVYATFFFLPIILGIELLLTNKEKEFHYTTFCIMLGFFLSYIGYFLVPAIGPRFTLHEFAATNNELPGLFLTNYLREIVNLGESIPSGTIDPAEIVQRDVFPSGHTQMTLLVMYLSLKFKAKTRYFFIPNGTLLIFSTVYLRYHYVIDLIAGFLFMILTLMIGKRIYNWWVTKKGEERFEFPEY